MNPTSTTAASNGTTPQHQNAGRAGAGEPARPLSAEEWVEQFRLGWERTQGPEAFAEHFRPLLSADVRLRGPQLPPMTGFEAFKESFVKPTFALIPDVRAELERWAASERAATDATIYIEITLHGTIGRRPLSFRACDRLTLREGVAVERESYFDPLPLLLGVLRSPSVWPRFVRLQLGTLTQRIGARD